MNSDAYVDDILQKIRNDPSISSVLDPLEFTVSKDSFKVDKGKITGLSSLQRQGGSTISKHGDTTKVCANVVVKNVKAKLVYQVDAGITWLKGDAQFIITKLVAKLEMSGSDGKTQLDSFEVTDLGKYELKKITGLSPVLNPLLKMVTNNLAQSLRDKIIHTLNKETPKKLRSVISQYDFLST